MIEGRTFSKRFEFITENSGERFVSKNVSKINAMPLTKFMRCKIVLGS